MVDLCNFMLVSLSLIFILTLSNGKVTLNEQQKIAWRKKLKDDALNAITKFEGHKNTIIYWAGAYLAAHKYYGVDYRKIVKKSTFYRQFAVPVLSEFHPVAKRACEEGAVSCIKDVYVHAAQSATMFSLYHNNIFVFQELSYPFESLEEMFRYRMTASYYLCWYTLRKDLGVSRAYPHCLNYFNGRLIHEGIGKPLSDVRNGLNRPFNCEMLWFCPDPCYGRSTEGVVQNFKTDSGNPCAYQPNSDCGFPPEANVNFHDLIRNKFNYTCSCGEELTGYAWDKQYTVCSDFDECTAGNTTCLGNKQCVNTDGGYTCRCKVGMIETRRGECVCPHHMRLNAEGGCSCPTDYRITSRGTCEPLPFSTTTSKSRMTSSIDIVDTGDSAQDVFGGLDSFEIDDVFSFSTTVSINKMSRWLLLSLLIVQTI